MTLNPSIDIDKLKADVVLWLGHDVSHQHSRGHHTFSYGYALVRINTPWLWDSVVLGRCEGKGHTRGETPEEYYIDHTSINDWWSVLVKTCADILATGRTVECGPGIGIRTAPWYFKALGQPCDQSWEHITEQVEGSSGRVRDVPWDMNPDYQRGSVWTQDQQERFIGHVLAGGGQPLIYIQRYDSPKNAPKGIDYLDLPNEVIDGQQRLRAIMKFMAGEIGAQVYHSGEWHRYMYADTNERERGFTPMSSKVVFVDLPRTDRLRFYLRLNSGVAHTDEELDRVRRMLAEEMT